MFAGASLHNGHPRSASKPIGQEDIPSLVSNITYLIY